MSAVATDMITLPTHSTMKEAQEVELEQLRALILGSEYESLLELKRQLQDQDQYTMRVASIIAEALKLRAEYDSEVTNALAPAVEESISRLIYNDPKKLANTLYPIMGPAIRKSINETLSQTLETFNQLLEQSLSPRSLRWRFDAWRTGRRYADVVLMNTLVYQVEQVFLIHHETSLLLQHVVSEQAIAKDPDMVSSMLAAIQDFMADSFVGEQESGLNSLKLGELSILIERSPYMVLAAVVRGNAPVELRELLRDTLSSLHQRFESIIHNYQGDSSPFKAAEPLLSVCLKVQHSMGGEGKKSQPWLAYGVLAAILATGGYFWYQHWQQQKLWESTLQQWQAMPGVVIQGINYVDGHYQVRGLLDPLAQAPNSRVTPELEAKFHPQFSWQPFLSLEPDLIVKRAKAQLQPPAGVQLALDKQHTLQVSGRSDAAWFNELKAKTPFLLGVQALDSHALQVTATPIPAPEPDLKAVRAEQIQALSAKVNQFGYYFAKAESAVNSENEAALQLAGDLRQLLSLVLQQNQLLQVTLLGYTDNGGQTDKNKNERMQRLRAENFKAFLVAQQFPVFLLSVEAKPKEARNERSVRVEVKIY